MAAISPANPAHSMAGITLRTRYYRGAVRATISVPVAEEAMLHLYAHIEHLWVQKNEDLRLVSSLIRHERPNVKAGVRRTKCIDSGRARQRELAAGHGTLKHDLASEAEQLCRSAAGFA